MTDADFFSSEAGNNFRIFTFTLNIETDLHFMSIEDYSLLVHEYTHYLQSVGTISGINALLKYFDLVKKIYVDVNGLICNGEEFETDYLTKYSDDYDKLISCYNTNLDKDDDENLPDYTLCSEKNIITVKGNKIDDSNYFITCNKKKYIFP